MEVMIFFLSDNSEMFGRKDGDFCVPVMYSTANMKVLEVAVWPFVIERNIHLM